MESELYYIIPIGTRTDQKKGETDCKKIYMKLMHTHERYMRSKYCYLWFVFTYSSRDETRIKHFILLYWLFSEVPSKLFGSSLEMTRATQQAFVFVLRRNMVSVHIQKKMFRKIVLALHHCTVKRMAQKQLYVIKSEIANELAPRTIVTRSPGCVNC